MKKEDYQTRLTKKQEDIVKINRRIAKWSLGMNSECIRICKEYGYSEYNTPERAKARQVYRDYLESHKNDDTVFSEDLYGNKGPNPDELMRAYSDLFEADNTVRKYQAAIDKIDNFDNEEKIPVLVEFLENWKEKAKKWYMENTNKYIQLRAKEEESWKAYRAEHPAQKEDGSNSSSDVFYQNLNEKDRWIKKYYGDIATLSKELYERGHWENHIKTPDWNYLENILEEEKRAKYRKLVDSITAIVGVIQDVKNLSIGNQQGELNGIVTGDKGKAKIETIGAGGYNIQIFHYRVLIHKIG